MPWVTVYWFLPERIASIAAAFTGSATSKSGRPIDRLIGSFIALAMSNALRMPEASMWLIRSAIQASFIGRSGGRRSTQRRGRLTQRRKEAAKTQRIRELGQRFDLRLATPPH